MSTRTTALLLVILVALGGYVWWSGRSSAGPATTPTPKAPTIWQIDPGEVQTIVVDPADGSPARVERDGAGWRITSPAPPTAGDADTITRTLTSLATLQARRALTDTADLAAYGLTSPTMTLHLETNAGQFSLTVGDTTPNESAYYARREGDNTVYLIDKYVLDGVKDWPTSPPLPPPPTPTFPPVMPTETPAAAASETPTP